MAVSVVTAADGSRLVRGYGLADHPNILGGLLAFASLLLVVAPGRDDPARTGLGEAAVRRRCRGAAAHVLARPRAWRSAWAFVVLAGDARGAAARRTARRSGMSSARRRSPRIVCLPFALAYGPYVLARSDPFGRHRAPRCVRSSEREALTIAANDVFLDHPVLGVGLGGLPLGDPRRTAAVRRTRTSPRTSCCSTSRPRPARWAALLYLAILVTPWLALARHRPRWTPELARRVGGPRRGQRRRPLRLLHVDLPGGPDLDLGRARAVGRGLPARDRAGLRDRAALAVRRPQRGGGRCLRSCSSRRCSSTSRSCSLLFGFGVNFLYLTRRRDPDPRPPARPSRSRPRTLAVGHRPAADLQRALRGAPARSRRSPRSTTRSTGSRSRSSTTPPTRPATIVADAGRAAARAPGLDDPPRPAREPARLQGGRARVRLDAGAGRAARDLRRRLRAAAATSCGDTVPVLRGRRGPRVRPGPLGPHEPRLLAADAAPGALDRRPLRRRAGRPLGVGGNWFNFNGTAGVWRRDALDRRRRLARRHADRGPRPLVSRVHLARLARRRMSATSTAPAELPVSFNAYRRQQHRWARGSFECAFKHLAADLAGAGPAVGEGRRRRST